MHITQKPNDELIFHLDLDTQYPLQTEDFLLPVI